MDITLFNFNKKSNKKKKRKKFSESELGIMSSVPQHYSISELIEKFTKQKYISLDDWADYYSIIQPTERFEVLKEFHEGTNTVIILIPNLLYVSRKFIGDYIRTETSLQSDIQHFIYVINRNRFNHFSVAQLKAFNKVVKYHEYGTRYKITKRDWRLVRNLLWKYKEYYRTKYIELYRSPLSTRGFIDFQAIVGPRGILNGNQIREYEEYIYLARNQKKIDAYRKFRSIKKRFQLVKKKLYYIPKIKTTYVPLKFPVRSTTKSQPSATAFIIKLKKDWIKIGLL